jgi:hypothetical protein
MFSLRRLGVFVSATVLLAACDTPQSTEILPQFAKSSGARAAFTFEAPTQATVASTNGLFHDGNATYTDGVARVQAYVGVSSKDADLVTYNTGRTLRFVSDGSAAWAASGIPATFNAEVDFWGINQWGRYQDMGTGTVAAVAGVVQFYVGRQTYELKYGNMAVKRLSATEWLITTDCLRLGDGCPTYGGITINSNAQLSVVRRAAQQTFGTVSMPTTFHVVLL